MKEILPILGSSAFGVFVTLIFNWLQNRRTASLNYITDERKKWREKIRTISAQIEMCEFRGTGEQRIGQYLTQLQMNINPYGSVYKFFHYYAYDAYIWDAIEGIRTAADREVFDKNKTLLLYDISLMLKLDWERSKKEVKNVSVIKFLWVAAVVCYVGIFLYGCFGLNLRNSAYAVYLFLVDFLLLAIALLGSCLIATEFQNDDNRNILSLKLFVRRYLTENRMVSYGLVVIAVVFAVRFLGTFLAVPHVLLGNMTYFADADGQIYLDAGFDDRYLPDFEKRLQGELGETVILLKEEGSALEETVPPDKYGWAIKSAITDGLMVFFFVSLIRDSLFLAAIFMLCRMECVDDRANQCINLSRDLLFHDYRENIDELPPMIGLAIEKLNRKDWRKQTDELLGLAASLLWRMNTELDYQIGIGEGQIETIRELEKNHREKYCLEVVGHTFVLLKKFSRSRRKIKRYRILTELKKDVEEIVEILV